jgi:hypothetical protein
MYFQNGCEPICSKVFFSQMKAASKEIEAEVGPEEKGKS